jgi:hypothetical protein
MDLSVITAMLPDHQQEKLAAAVDKLEAGVAASLVRNSDFTKAKETINWCVETAAKAFLETGPQTEHRYLRWWNRAYDANALIAGFDVHNLPSILRRARDDSGLTEYADFIETALMPLHALLQATKPLVVKRGEAGHPPPPKTPAQLAREAAQMTCQCCGGLYLANLGTVAHHGYRRPGDGWQTASCAGAKELPFEVSRDCLGNLIDDRVGWERNAVADRAAIAEERRPIVLKFSPRDAQRDSRGNRPTVSVTVTRETFHAVWREHLRDFTFYSWNDFDAVKDYDLQRRDRDIRGVREDIKAQQARFDAWKQTHRWDAAADGWKAICECAA